MHIDKPLYVNGYFLSQPFTGTGIVTIEHLKNIRKLSPKRKIILLFLEGQVEHPEEFGKTFSCDVHVMKLSYKIPGFLRRFIWEYIAIPRFFRDKTQSTYFSTFLHPMMSFPGKGNTFAMILHDIFPWKYSAYSTKATRKLYNFLMKRTITNPKLTLITVSNTSRRDIISYFHLKKPVEVIVNGVDHVKEYPLESYIEVQEKFHIRRPYIFYMGGYDTRKRIVLLIEAFKMLRKEHAELLLVLGGNIHYQSNLYTDIKELLDGLPGVIHTGFLSASDMKSLYHYAAVVAHPTADEGFNVAIGEALMEKVPVLASDIPVHQELWGKWIELVDFTDTQKVCKLLEEIIYSSNYVRKEMTSEDEQIFAWKHSAEQLLRLL
ncbi:MAG: glycosyltransferase family 4 protein [Candidatus Gracilibacteria bacterium]